ncbi:MAG: YdcF family protein [Archangium sp.]
MSWLLLTPLLIVAVVMLQVHRIGRSAVVLPSKPLPAIVLGARVWPDGTPSDALRDRVSTGVKLLLDGHATKLVFSGGSPDQRPTEAAVMQALAIAAKAPPDALELEATSRSTFENARHCAAQIPERTVILVTCDFHLARATAYFRAEGFTVFPVPSRRSLRPVDRWRVTSKEALALLWRPRLLWGLRRPRSV